MPFIQAWSIFVLFLSLHGPQTQNIQLDFDLRCHIFHYFSNRIANATQFMPIYLFSGWKSLTFPNVVSIFHILYFQIPWLGAQSIYCIFLLLNTSINLLLYFSLFLQLRFYQNIENFRWLLLNLLQFLSVWPSLKYVFPIFVLSVSCCLLI